jgi:transglutaminase-like putative cysteine protease
MLYLKPSILPTTYNKPLTTALTLSRLWMGIAVMSALLCHVLQGLNGALLISLINCLGFIGWQYYTLKHLKNNLNKRLSFLGIHYKYLIPIIAIIFIVGLFYHYGTVFGREVGIAGLSILSVFKLWEYRNARDAQIISGLLFFLLLTVFLKQESAWVLLSVIISATLILSAWIFFNIYIGTNDSIISIHNKNNPIVISYTHSLGETLKLALYGLPLTFLLFFVFPRISGPLWGLPNDANSSKLGLSSTLEPGKFAKLMASEGIALRAKFDTQFPHPNKKETIAGLYWRGLVLSQFDGIIWSAKPWNDTQFLPINHPNTLNYLNNNINLAHYQITTEPHQQTFRVLLDTPVYSNLNTKINPDLTASSSILLERETLQAISTIPVINNSPIIKEYNSAFKLNTPQDLNNNLLLPINNNPLSRIYAAQIRTQILSNLAVNTSANDPTPYIQAVLLYYKNNFKYATEPRIPKGRTEDAIDGFLFDTREGYCEHFAASFVVLMRMIGLPARIVTGYQGGELNPKDGWIEVYNNSAHTWAEVWHPTQGWLRVDPTTAVAPWLGQLGATERRNNANQPAGIVGDLLKNTQTILKPLQQWAQTATQLWQDYGLNYGKNNQQTLFKTLGFTQVNMQILSQIIAVGLSIWGLIMLIIYRQKQRSLTPHGKALKQFDRQCTRLNYPRLNSQTPRAWFNKHEKSLNKHQQIRLKKLVLNYEVQYFYPKKN